MEMVRFGYEQYDFRNQLTFILFVVQVVGLWWSQVLRETSKQRAGSSRRLAHVSVPQLGNGNFDLCSSLEHLPLLPLLAIDACLWEQVSPFRIAREARAAGQIRGSKTGCNKFEKEFLVWRGLAFAWCFHFFPTAVGTLGQVPTPLIDYLDH
eukprot:COSAG02_NODE_1079_length_14711_cov_86.326512_11_plen_152_part_00